MSDPKRPRLDPSLSTSNADDQTGVDTQTSANSRRHSSSTRTDGRRRFECTYAGCGRNYSRAEHLYRHQLNRTYDFLVPKDLARSQLTSH